MPFTCNIRLHSYILQSVSDVFTSWVSILTFEGSSRAKNIKQSDENGDDASGVQPVHENEPDPSTRKLNNKDDEEVTKPISGEDDTGANKGNIFEGNFTKRGYKISI